jgi:hypothetical protein
LYLSPSGNEVKKPDGKVEADEACQQGELKWPSLALRILFPQLRTPDKKF